MSGFHLVEKWACDACGVLHDDRMTASACCPESEFMTSSEVAKMLSMSQRTVEGWRSGSHGPPYTTFGTATVRYRRADLLAWIESRNSDRKTGGETP